MKQVLHSTGAGDRILAVAIAAAVLLSLAYAPKARAEDSRWYVGAALPVMYIDDTDTTTEGSNITMQGAVPYKAEAVTKYDTGYKLEGVLGYELGSNFRIELELFYAEADVDTLTYSNVSTTTAQGPQSIPGKVPVTVTGAAKQLGGLVNLWYDFDTGSNWVPYLGAGIGFIEIDQGDLEYDDNTLAQDLANKGAVAQVARTLGVDPAQLAQTPQGQMALAGALAQAQLPPGYVPRISSTDTVVAYQFAAGVSYRFRDNVMLRLGYRYQTTDDMEFSGKNATGVINTETKLEVQFLEVGIRYHF